MKFDLSPQLAGLVEEVRDWSVTQLRPFAREADRTHEIPALLWKAFDNAPFGGDVFAGRIELDASRNVPEGLYMQSTSVAEAAAYGDMTWAMISKGIGTKAVSVIGTPEQIDKWTGGVDRGEYRFSGFGLTEPGSGSDAAGLRTTARREGDSWVLNGTKMFITGGALSDWVVVFATIDRSLGHRGIRGFVVERGTPGFTVGKANEEKLGIRALCTSELVFRDVVVPDENLLGTPETQPNSFRNVLMTLNTTRQQVAAMSVGIASAALDEGHRLLAERRLEFAPHRWSRIQDDFDAMRRALHGARLMARRAAWHIDTGRSFGREASTAKAYAPPLAEKVIRRVLNLLGPDGWSEEYLIEKWHRDVKIMDLWEGTGQIHRQIVARQLLGQSRR